MKPFRKTDKKALQEAVSSLTLETRAQMQKNKERSEKPIPTKVEPKKPFMVRVKEVIKRIREPPTVEKQYKAPTFKEQMREQREQAKAKNRRKKLTAQEQRRHLDMYLSKAGFFETSAEFVKNRIWRIALNISATLWIVPIILAIINGRSFGDFIVWALLYTVTMFFVLGGIWILLWGVTYFYLEMRIYHRTRELEEVLPDFLQLTSSNISAGMPIDRALWLAIRPNFGVLAKEIEDVAKATLSGEDLSDSLRELVNRYDSKTLKRSISILLEGLEAGGELADLLNKIALNIQELRIMKKEMAANVTTYAIFISFASVGIAPVLFALATQLVAVILSITSGLDLSGASSSFQLTTTVNPDLLPNFRLYSYLMLAVTAGMSAAIISVIRNGNVKDGIRNIPLFILFSLVIYWMSSLFFGNIFSGFF